MSVQSQKSKIASLEALLAAEVAAHAETSAKLARAVEINAQYKHKEKTDEVRDRRNWLKANNVSSLDLPRNNPGVEGQREGESSADLIKRMRAQRAASAVA